MNAPIDLMLIALVLFQIKHFLCDFVFQTLSQVRAKGIYGRFGGVQHAGMHALASLPALLVLTRSPLTIAIIVVAEFVVHYHVDWTKAHIDASQGWTIEDQKYWILFGLDQFIHQLTYAAILYFLTI